MKQISFCDDDCEISKMLACTSAVVENVRPTTSGTPTIPGPPTVISATSRMAVSAFTPPPLLRPLGSDLRAGLLGRETISNPNGNARLRHGAQRLRMKHLRAEIGQLGRFEIGNFGNGARLGNQARIGGQHAIHVGPDNYLVSAERCAQNRGGIIRSAAARAWSERRYRRADKACHDRNNSAIEQRPQPRFRPRVRVDPSAGRRRRDRNR